MPSKIAHKCHSFVDSHFSPAICMRIDLLPLNQVKIDSNSYGYNFHSIFSVSIYMYNVHSIVFIYKYKTQHLLFVMCECERRAADWWIKLMTNNLHIFIFLIIDLSFKNIDNLIEHIYVFINFK